MVEKNLGHLVGDEMIDFARKNGLLVIKGRSYTSKEIEENNKRSYEVSCYLENLKRFEEESRKQGRYIVCRSGLKS